MSPAIGSAPDANEHAAGRRRGRRAWYAVANALVALWGVAAAVVGAVEAHIPAAEWLVVHLLLLGAVTSAILVWSQHFADTLTRRGAPGGRRALATRLGLHTVGAVVVVLAVSLGVWPAVIVGGAAVAVAAAWHVVSLTLQLRGALPSRFAPLVRYYIVAALFLIMGVAVGVLMAGQPAAGDIRDRLFVAHIAANLGGWVGLTVIGTVILLWPTVLHARILPTADAAGRRSLPLASAGLIVAGAGCLIDVRVLVPLGLAAFAAAVILVLVETARQARQAPPTSYAAWSMGASLVWFLGSVLALLALTALAPGWAAIAAGLPVLLLPFVLGFVAQLVVAALSHLIPVVFGGGPARARRMYAELERLGAFRAIVVNGALLLCLLPLPAVTRVVLLAVATLALLSIVPLGVRAIVGRDGATPRGSREATPPGGRAAPPAHQPPATGPRAGATLHELSGSMMAAAGTLVLAVALSVSLAPVGIASGLPGAVVPGASAGQNGSADEVAATGHTTTVAMTMKNMRFSPATVRVPAGDRLVIHLVNRDDQVHDLTLADGTTSGRLVGGARATVDAGVIRSNIDGWCSITGHRQMGMVMRIVAVGAPSENAAAVSGAQAGSHDGMHMGGGAGGADATGSAGSAADDIDLAKSPPASFSARDATVPPVGAGTTHRLTLTVRDTLTEVSPGVWQTLWTYNGTAPGPTLHGRVGDTFVITLVNRAPMGHSIDFHAGALAPNKPMRTIEPGQRLTYTFTATRAGIWLYHCSTMPMSVHIANGMFGAVIIDPPGLDPVDREFVFVQSEYYLGAQKGIADAAKVAAKTPDLVTFNGYADQYRARPIAVSAGDRVRVWVLDAGPNLPSAFHVVGAQFDTVFEEGDYLLRAGGSTGVGGSQVLGMQPAQGGFVEFTLAQPGDYSFVTHIMSDAERGASGVFHVSG
ncbi:multicopper oxidase domain-containing protein [Microbacterium sp. STN6]|uniref:multicopper oxidase domain-containing protein n=1 Tax=Microbacterium sp. STN6 TaxID=2995588 RepID=UPI002260B58C|nr:multicopper oxidase domain-containing protein [Microbacterium sp. STN6]MCX7521449.1 multicopper oxidase domain-containing protein [Microbacterium sp. STN6]